MHKAAAPCADFFLVQNNRRPATSTERRDKSKACESWLVLSARWPRVHRGFAREGNRNLQVGQPGLRGAND